MIWPLCPYIKHSLILNVHAPLLILFCRLAFGKQQKKEKLLNLNGCKCLWVTAVVLSAVVWLQNKISIKYTS